MEIENSQTTTTTPSNPATTTPETKGPISEDLDFGALADSFVSDAPEADTGPVNEVVPPVSSSSSSSSSSSPAPDSGTARTGSPDGAVSTSPAEPSSATPAPSPVATEPRVEAVKPEVPSQPVAEPVQPAAAPVDPMQTIQEIKSKALPELEKIYALGSDEAAGLVDEGLATLLPKQFAKLHFEVQTGIYTALQQSLPAMFQAMLEQNNRVESFKNQFYDTWKELRGKDENIIIGTLEMYRRTFPQADDKTVIEQAGALVMQRFGLDPIASRQKSVAPPAPQPINTPVHMPAGAGAAGGPVHQRNDSEENMFSTLAEQWHREQFG